MDTYKYTCAACGKPVLIKDGQPQRECEHKDAAVIANMSAVARGVGGVK